MLLPARSTTTSKRVFRSGVVSPSGGKQMGTVYAELELANAGDLFMHRRGLLPEDKVKRMNIDAFVDSGSYMRIITENVQQQLELPFIEAQLLRMVDESAVRGQVFGPVEIRFENRLATGDAVALKCVTGFRLGSLSMYS